LSSQKHKKIAELSAHCAGSLAILDGLRRQIHGIASLPFDSFAYSVDIRLSIAAFSDTGPVQTKTSPI